jgi:hypothetical protein
MALRSNLMLAAGLVLLGILQRFPAASSCNVKVLAEVPPARWRALAGATKV